MDLPGYLEDLLQRVSMAMETSRIQVEIPADLPPVCADYARLERILVNLLSNALKYSTPAPRCACAPGQQEGRWWWRSPTRDGALPRKRCRISSNVFTARKGARKAEGIGLGLYITRVLVEAHGGRIWVESEAGKGSTFVSLPSV